MKNKGFTLIELLAVIVILAIIALIATPIVVNIINNSRESANLRSAELYLDALEEGLARENLFKQLDDDVITCIVSSNSKVSCNGNDIKVDIDKPATGGTVVFTKGKLTSVEGLIINGKTYRLDSNGKLVKSDTSELACTNLGSNSYTYSITEEDCSYDDETGEVLGCEVDGITNTYTVTYNTIQCGDEDFYSIGEEGNNIKLLPKYSIDLTTNVQSPSAGNIAFADNTYWWDEDNYYFASGYPKANGVYDSNSNIYEHLEGVNGYKANLISKGINLVDVRLANVEEMVRMGCVAGESDDYDCSQAPSWLYSKSYWLESYGNISFDPEQPAVTYMNYGGYIGYDTFYTSANATIRPVVIIPKSSVSGL